MRLLSTRELSDALGVSESSLKRWVDTGRIAASRTEGGHRRIALSEAMRFIRDTGAPLVRPELLDLPEVAIARERDHGHLLGYLLEGDSVGARGWLTARYLEGATIAELGDGPIRDAMAALGELWRHQDGGVFLEHRGTDVCLQAVAQLRGMSSASLGPDAPVALGGGPAGDPYILPTQLAAMVVGHAGMQAINLGPNTPAPAFAHACTAHRPRLIWLSVSAPLAPARAGALARWLASLPAATAIVVGGQQARTLGQLPPRAQRAGSMAELAELAGAIVARAAR